MTDELMALQGLLEKTSGADLLRDMFGCAAERLMELDVGSKTGAAWGEKSTARLTAMTLDEPAGLFAEMHAGMARLRETLDAMGRSVSVLERTAVELRQDVTRLGDRVDRLEPRVDGIEARLERIELRLDVRGPANGEKERWTPRGTSPIGR